jgi:RNA polymerase sigma-70 factor (ECF subfamily)
MAAETDLAPLIARVALRDRAAFERLYRATSASLLGLAIGILQRRDRAEDVLQEAFIKVWHGAAAYDATVARPMTWLIHIVRHQAIDRLRSQRGEQARTVVWDDESLREHADPDAPQPLQLLEASLARAHIDVCMAALSAPQRQAIALAYYRGLVHTEIAGLLDAPLGTVKAWVRRGVDRLRDCLEAAGVQGA